MYFDAIQLLKTLSHLARRRQGVHIAGMVGSPMYSSHTGVIPITEVLLEKDAPSGTIQAPMKSVAITFLSERIISCKVIETSLITSSTGFLFVAFVVVGYYKLAGCMTAIFTGGVEI